ncbi:hypothetical protein EDB87DRAFT_1182836 [Lactarius vividus]|nr:hypothetical protein EDB87DRAFT_1182836 [Lactarius vividus]
MRTQSYFPVSLPSFKPLPSIDSPSVRPRHLRSDPSFGTTSNIRKITREDCKKRKNELVVGTYQQSIRSQTTSCLKYLISIEASHILTIPAYGNGTYWCMCAKGGDISYLHHHTVSISEFSAHTTLPSGRILASGQSFLSSLIIAMLGAALRLVMKIMLLLLLSNLAVYVPSGLS